MLVNFTTKNMLPLANAKNVEIAVSASETHGQLKLRHSALYSSPAAVKALGDAGFAAAPVGAGPFKFVSWERGKQVVVTGEQSEKNGLHFVDMESVALQTTAK